MQLYIREVLAGCKHFLLQDSVIPPLIPPAPVGENKRKAQKPMCCNTAEHCNEQMKEKLWIGLRLWIGDRKGAASFTVCVCAHM